MRPPEFTGGNRRKLWAIPLAALDASMRPPEFTGGNSFLIRERDKASETRFNEAAGIHRRKRKGVRVARGQRADCFNEAAGIHRRKLVNCYKIKNCYS